MKKRINDSIFSKYIFLGIIVIILVFTLINLKSYTGNPIVVNNNPISLCGISDVSGPTPTQPSGIQAPSTAQAAPAQPAPELIPLPEDFECNSVSAIMACQTARGIIAFKEKCDQDLIDTYCRPIPVTTTLEKECGIFCNGKCTFTVWSGQTCTKLVSKCAMFQQQLCNCDPDNIISEGSCF